MVSKSPIHYRKGINLGFKFRGEWEYNFLNLYEYNWPKFDQVSKKSTEPSDVGTLRFRWIIHFWYFSFQKGYKASKSSNARDFLWPIIQYLNLVPAPLHKNGSFPAWRSYPWSRGSSKGLKGKLAVDYHV